VFQTLNEERRALAAKSVGHAERISKRWEWSFPEHVEDLKSSALWGVVRAAATYEVDKGQTWDRWLAACVNGEMKNFLGGKQVNEWNKWIESYGYIDGLPVESEDWFERNDALDNLLSKLTKRQRELCELSYRYGMTNADASKELGMTPKLGWKIHNAAINRLRRKVAA